MKLPFVGMESLRTSAIMVADGRERWGTMTMLHLVSSRLRWPVAMSDEPLESCLHDEIQRFIDHLDWEPIEVEVGSGLVDRIPDYLL